MSVLTVSEVKEHLNITAGTWDDELAGTIDAAEAAIARAVGPLESATVTSSVRGVGGSMVLPVRPVISLTSLTPYQGTPIDTAGVYLDGEAGVIEMVTGEWFANVRHTVVYVAGRATLPADLAMAVKELVKVMWGSQRGGSKRPGTGQSEAYSNTLAGSADAFPYSVERLIRPHRTVSAA